MSLDGSSLIDIGSNSGVIVTLNNDMVQEVKVQSSNFAAEYGAGGMNVSGVTKSGTSKFHGSVYDYSRDYRFAANDRSNSIAGTPKPKSKYQYPGGNIGGPITFGDSYTKNRDKLFFFVAFEVQRQQVDSGSRFNRTYSQAMRNGDFSELLANRGSNLNSIAAAAHPAGIPERRAAGAEQRHAAVHHADSASTSRACIRCRTTTTRTISTTTSTAASSRPNRHRLQEPLRLEHQQQHEGVRPRRARG